MSAARVHLSRISNSLSCGVYMYIMYEYFLELQFLYMYVHEYLWVEMYVYLLFL